MLNYLDWFNIKEDDDFQMVKLDRIFECEPLMNLANTLIKLCVVEDLEESDLVKQSINQLIKFGFL